MLLEKRVWTWAKIPERYVKESVAKVEKYLAELAVARWKLPKKKYENPFIGYYEPDMDKIPDLD